MGRTETLIEVNRCETCKKWVRMGEISHNVTNDCYECKDCINKHRAEIKAYMDAYRNKKREYGSKEWQHDEAVCYCGLGYSGPDVMTWATTHNHI